MSKLRDKIVSVLLKNEHRLTDGYEFYCGGWEGVPETLEEIADEIVLVINTEGG